MDKDMWTNTFPSVARSWLVTAARERQNNMGRIPIGVAMHSAEAGERVQIVRNLTQVATVVVTIPVSTGQIVFSDEIELPDESEYEEDDEYD